MNSIGSKIYYDMETGNVLVRTFPVAYGGVETTIEQDIVSFKVLSERNRETFDVLNLPYGYFTDEFSKATSFRVNPTTKEIEFNYDPLFTLDDYKRFKIDEFYKKCEQIINSSFIATVLDSTNAPYEIYYDLTAQQKFSGQTNLVNLWLNRLSLGEITQVEFDAKFPIQWRTKSHGWVGFTYQQYIQLTEDASNHERTNYQKRGQLEAQVNACITKVEVEAIVW